MIERKCKNCAIETGIEDYCYYCDNYKFGKNEFSDDKFIPQKELVRADERHKIITLLKSDLENYNGLAIEKADNNHCRVSLEYNEVRKYIKSTIELLEGDQQ